MEVRVLQGVDVRHHGVVGRKDVSDQEDVPVWELVGSRLDRHIRARKRLASTVTGSSVFGRNNNSSLRRRLDSPGRRRKQDPHPHPPDRTDSIHGTATQRYWYMYSTTGTSLPHGHCFFGCQRRPHQLTHWFTNCQRRPNQPTDEHRPTSAGPASHPCQDLVHGWQHDNPSIPRLFGSGGMIVTKSKTKLKIRFNA